MGLTWPGHFLETGNLDHIYLFYLHISSYICISYHTFHFVSRYVYIYIYIHQVSITYMYMFHPLHFPPVFRGALQAMEVPRIKRKKHHRSCKSNFLGEHDRKKVTARLHLQDLGITWPNFQRIHARRMVSGFDIRFLHFFGCMASCFISFDVWGCFIGTLYMFFYCFLLLRPDNFHQYAGWHP